MTPNDATACEYVTFLFPRDWELALYALATLQSFVEYYPKAMERVHIAAAHPESQRELKIALHCEQQFYLMFKDSFPPCVEWMVPGLTVDDEMLIDLREEQVNSFQLAPGYSVQWAMGSLAGTMPRMLPKITHAASAEDGLTVVDTGCAADALPLYETEGMVHFVTAATLPPAQAYQYATRAKFVVAPQSFLTVLAVALGRYVLETTPTASHRSMLSSDRYVQVSRLMPETFFYDALNRGMQCLLQKAKSPSAAPTAATTSSPSPQPSA